MRRILLFALTYQPFVGGAEVAIKEITDRIDPSDYSFDMITLRFDSDLPRVEKIGNITVHRVGFSIPGAKVSDRSMPWQCKVAKILFPFTAFFKALSLNGKHRYDTIWSMMANQAAFGALFFSTSLKLRGTSKRTPYVLELQDGRAFADMRTRRPVLRVLWPLYRQLYMRADVIKVISKYIGSEVRGIGYEGKIEIIPNAVDTKKFSAPVSLEKISQLRAKYGKQRDDVFLFTASRLVLSRGVEDVIESLIHLPSNVKLLIAGDGDDREKLQHLVIQFDISNRVIFLGHVNHDELPSLLRVADIFVRPSIIEGFGNAFVEAFAAGIPVIGTPVGGIPDFLHDRETGIFCAVRDPRSIASAVQIYLNDHALTMRIIENARKLAEQKYDWNIIAKDMREKIFDAV